MWVGRVSSLGSYGDRGRMIRVRSGVEAEIEVVPFENWKRSFEPKNAGGLLELEKAKRWLLA